MNKRIVLSAAVATLPIAEAVEMTFGELCAAYDARMCNGGDAARLRKWEEWLGKRSAWSIMPTDLENGRDAMRAAGYKPSAINRDLSSIGSVYIFAKDRKLSPAGFVSPSVGIRRDSEPIRVVEITPETNRKLIDGALAHADRRFGLFVRLLSDTGARKGEIYGRRWRDFDFARRQIALPETKNGRPHTLFYSEDTARLIERTRPRGNDAGERYVFEGRFGRPKSYRRAWLRLCRDIGADLHMHDLRHGAAARLLRSGVSLAVAAQVLNHDPRVLARRYGHLETATLQRAQEQAWREAA